MGMKEDGERKGWQTRGKSFFSAARGIGLDLGWVSVAPLVLARTGADKMVRAGNRGRPQWPGSRKSRMAAGVGKVGSLPSQGFFSTGILLSPARGHSWPSLAWLLAVVSWVFASSAPWTSEWAGLGNNQHLGNVLRWCINSCVSAYLSAPDSWTQDGRTHITVVVASRLSCRLVTGFVISLHVF